MGRGGTSKDDFAECRPNLLRMEFLVIKKWLFGDVGVHVLDAKVVSLE